MVMRLASFWNLTGPDLLVPFVILIGIPIVIALRLNRRFQQRNPGKRPFTWGYYFSILYFIVGLCVGAKVGITAGVKDGITAVIILGAIHGVLAWFFAQRHHWAWITVTILSGNPVVWIINFIYLRKRWSEDSVATQPI